MEKKRNAFVRFFCAIGRGIKRFFMFLMYILFYPFVKIATHCKVLGKENIDQSDEARVFLVNHYEIFGPVAMYLNFPIKNRIWIIDKMMNEADIEQQMGLMIYNNFPKVPRWLKTCVIKLVKSFIVYIFVCRAKGIPVSRENPRANIKAMEISCSEFEKGKAIILMPERWYVKEGVGEFQTGFEYIAKYTYKKTKKIVTFYPVFVSQVDKKIYVEKPIRYNPENDPNSEKDRIITYCHDEMVKSYKLHEVDNPSKKMQKYRLKQEKKMQKEKKEE